MKNNTESTSKEHRGCCCYQQVSITALVPSMLILIVQLEHANLILHFVLVTLQA